MSLVDDVSAAIIDAMRRKDSGRLSALRMLKAAMMNKSVEKGHDLDDAEARQVVGALVKQRRDSIEQFQKGGRQDLVDKETAEIAVLESYLPPAADPALVDGRDGGGCRNRRRLAEGHRQGHESCHGEARRADR